MLVATASFIASTPYGEIRVRKGVTHIDPGHELAKTHAHCFRPESQNPLGGGQGRAVAERPTYGPGSAAFRSSTRAPSAPTPSQHTSTQSSSHRPRWYMSERPGPVPELRDKTGGLTVRLTPTAHKDLLGLVQAARSGDETGGLLIGARPRSWRSIIDIVIVTGPGPDALHQPRSYAPDLQHDRDMIARAQEQFGGELLTCGAWHSHPANADDLPSEPDRREMARARSRLAIPFVVELIATSDPARGWSCPQFSAWIIRAEYEGSRSTVVERARLHGSSR